MYRKLPVNQLAFDDAVKDFVLPFGGNLQSNNRWVLLAQHIPWAEVETAYAQQFSQEDLGSPAKASRLALGALILQERLGVTDRELVAQIAENPYLQYFVGLTTYQHEAPFHHSLLTTFRKRFTHESLSTINEAIARLIAEAQSTKEPPSTTERSDTKDDDEPPPPNGQLLVDATCVPADITYPTDLKLLNEAREKTEEMIDDMHARRTTPTKKPRNLSAEGEAGLLGPRQGPKTGEAEAATRDRATAPVSAAQSVHHCSHGRRRAAYGFTPPALSPAPDYSGTLSATALDVHASMSPHRGSDCEHQPAARAPHCTRQSGHACRVWGEALRQYGWMASALWIASAGTPITNPRIWCPRSRHTADGLGMTPLPCTWIKSTARVRTGAIVRVEAFASQGPRWAALAHVPATTAEQTKRDHQQALDDTMARMAIEGKFGQGKRRFGLSRLMAKLVGTSETMIHVSFLVMNLEHLLTRAVFSWLWSWWSVWSKTWNSLLRARGLQIQPYLRDDRGDGLEVRGVRRSQLLAGV